MYVARDNSSFLFAKLCCYHTRMWMADAALTCR